MAHKYAEIMFTDQVKQVQHEQHSRSGYAGMEQGEDVNYLLSDYEENFIAARDSFYMASVNQNDWPYVQHRGGPAGFMRVLDAKTIGFADYTGNRQYISTGNFRKNDRVSIIFMDYPNRTRMKLIGRVSIVNEDDPETLAKLEVAEFRAPVERGFLIHLEAFDWNCPKYITPRFSEDEMLPITDNLKQENQLLQEQLAKYSAGSSQGTYPTKIGDGPLQLVISGIRQLTPEIRAYELRDIHGNDLPQITAGAHIQIPIQLDRKEQVLRHYSICSNPKRRDIYEIAVLNELEGKGGSRTIHKQFQLGLVLACQLPLNHFNLQSSLHQQGTSAVLIAGGVGITPIKPIAQHLRWHNVPFSMHYAGKSKNHMAFRDRLQREFGDDLNVYCSDENQRLNIKKVLTEAAPNSIFYLCGPSRLIDAVLMEADKLNIQPQRLCYERFSAPVDEAAKAITVTLNKSKKQIEVGAEESILDAMINADISVAYSCKTGDCKSCAVKVLAGTPRHLDNALSIAEQEQQGLFCPCVSRACTSDITLDV